MVKIKRGKVVSSRQGRQAAKRKDERRKKRQVDRSGPNVDVSLPNAEDADEEMEADREEDAVSEASYYSSSEEFGDEERAAAAKVRGCRAAVFFCPLSFCPLNF